MKLNIKTIVLAASLSFIGTSAFAAADIVVGTDVIVDSTAIDLAANNTWALTVDNSGFANNNAVIVQNGDGNYAAVEQATGTGNLVVIGQDSSTSPTFALVTQNGAINVAVVYQH